jgi:lysozyme
MTDTTLYRLQSDLKRLGYYPEEPDGKWGPVSRAAWGAAMGVLEKAGPAVRSLLTTGVDGRFVMHDFEKCRLTAYPDPATGGDPWTIGWGDTENVRPGMVITQEEADARFERRLTRDFEPVVRAAIKVNLTQRQFDALVSIVYNVGPGNAYRDGIIRLKSGEPSTLLRKLNAGDMQGAADAFLSWNRGGGKELLGLKRRRVAERELFLGKSGQQAAAIGWAVQS